LFTVIHPVIHPVLHPFYGCKSGDSPAMRQEFFPSTIPYKLSSIVLIRVFREPDRNFHPGHRTIAQDRVWIGSPSRIYIKGFHQMLLSPDFLCWDGTGITLRHPAFSGGRSALPAASGLSVRRKCCG
jgi:hypothetical protein